VHASLESGSPVVSTLPLQFSDQLERVATSADSDQVEISVTLEVQLLFSLHECLERLLADFFFKRLARRLREALQHVDSQTLPELDRLVLQAFLVEAFIAEELHQESVVDQFIISDLECRILLASYSQTPLRDDALGLWSVFQLLV
jgi:hypothetical protein